MALDVCILNNQLLTTVLTNTIVILTILFLQCSNLSLSFCLSLSLSLSLPILTVERVGNETVV